MENINKNKPKRTGGMKFGLFVMIMAFATPAFFWGLAYWRDMTQTYCSGECVTGWYAVISTFLALPTFILGLIIWGISFSRRNKKQQPL